MDSIITTIYIIVAHQLSTEQGSAMMVKKNRTLHLVFFQLCAEPISGRFNDIVTKSFL